MTRNPRIRRWAWRTAAALAILAAMAALILPGRSDATSPVTIARHVAASRERIRDLTVTFTFAASGPGAAGNLHGRSRMSVTSKGTMLRVDHEYGEAPVEAPLFRRIFSFDGRRSMTHDVTLGQAYTARGRDRSATTDGAGFFDVMMYHPDTRGRGSPDLVKLLRSSRVKVRPDMELVGERSCVVVDEIESGKAVSTLWLDPELGYLPLRQRYLIGAGVMELGIDEATEIEPSLWVPVRGYKTVGAGIAGPPISYTLVVERDPSGRAIVDVNTGVPDSAFDILATLPTGTRTATLSSPLPVRAFVATGSAVVLLIGSALVWTWRRQQRKGESATSETEDGSATASASL